MEFVDYVLVSACTAALLSFVVAKLVSLVGCSGELRDGKGFSISFDNGNKQRGLKAEGSRGKKKRIKTSSDGMVLVFEFEAKTEPDVLAKNIGGVGKADDFVDGCKESGCVEKGLEFLGMEVNMAYLGNETSEASSADQGLSAGKVGGMELSGIQKEDGYFGLNDPVKNEGRITSYEMPLNERDMEVEMGFKEAIGYPVEGLDQEPNSWNDLDKLIVYDDSRDYNVVEDIMASTCGSDQKADDGIVDHDEDGSLKETGNGGIEQDNGTGRSEPKKDDSFDVGFSGGKNGIDQDEHTRVLESAEIRWRDMSEDGYVDQIDDLHEENSLLASKENVVNRNEEGRMNDQNRGESILEISEGEEWEGIETSELERDFSKAVNFVECRVKEGRLNKLGSDVIMQFYGLQKVAMEGPCLQPQPMALMRSSRAKWTAWQKLGSMNLEEAMEKYVALLSDVFPRWMEGESCEEGRINSEEVGAYGLSDAKLRTCSELPLTCTDESKPGEEPVATGNLTGSSSLVNKDKA